MRSFSNSVPPLLFLIISLCFCGLCGIENGYAQEIDQVKDHLFKEAREAMERAEAEGIHFLSPQHFSEASRLFQVAQEDYEAGGRLESIRESLRKVMEHLDAAFETQSIARILMDDLIQMREEITALGFSDHAPRQFNMADSKFKAAIRAIEDGNVRVAKGLIQQSEREFRNMTIDVLQQVVLMDARQELDRAGDRIAPVARETAMREMDELTGYLDTQRDETFVVGSLFDEIFDRAENILRIAGVEVGTVDLSDLVLEEVRITPIEPNVGDDIMIHAVVKNAGSRFAEAIVVRCADAEEREIGRTVIDFLESEQSQEISFTSIAESAGDWRVTITIDPENVIRELDDENNWLTKRVDIGQRIPLPLLHSKNANIYSTKEVFMISDENWRDVLKLVSLTTWGDPQNKGWVKNYPTLIYHREGNNFDADAIIRFLQQYQPTHLTIFGNTPTGLDAVLVAAAPQGAGLNSTQISKVTMSSYLSHWSFINRVVVCEDDYETGLMASVFASYVNAPLIFDGHFKYDLLDKRVAYVVGKVSTTTTQEINKRCTKTNEKKDYTLDDLQKAYIGWTGTNKVVLVNPNDLSINYTKNFTVEKFAYPAGSTISTLYGKHSLTAPFLAAAKFEVIAATTSNTCLRIDDDVEKIFNNLKLSGPLTYLTIVANPLALPIARENRNTFPSLWGDRIVFEECDYSKLPTHPLNLSVVTTNPTTGSSKLEVITGTNARPLNPAIYKDKVVWQDYRNGKPDIYMYDLTTKKETRITSLTNSEQINPAIYGDKIVWQDNRNQHNNKPHWDIYMYDMGQKKETRITTDVNDQMNPDIFVDINYPDKIVWQDNRNLNNNKKQWDIYMYELPFQTETRITTNTQAQIHPKVHGSWIVWEDYRNGNADIYYCVTMPLSKPLVVTNAPGTQVYPRLSEVGVVWQDNQNKNWDVYFFDWVQKQARQITTSSKDQIRPDIQGYRIMWYSEGLTGIAPVHLAPPVKSDAGHWHVYLYDSYAKKHHVVHKSLLTHEYNRTFRQEADGRFYGSSNNYGKQERAVGRIFGVTPSDVSAYVARDLFFDTIRTQNRDALLIVREDHNAVKTTSCPANINPVIHGCTLEAYARSNYWTTSVQNAFNAVHFYAGTDAGPNPVDTHANTIRGLYDDSYLILYADHGGGIGFTDGIHHVVTSNHLNNISLLPSTVLDLACATGTASWGYIPADIQFGMENLRHGAMVYMGAVDLSYWHRMFDDILEGVFLQGKTIGEAYVQARNEDYNDNVYNFCQDLKGDPFYALYGDPTFKPKWW